MVNGAFMWGSDSRAQNGAVNQPVHAMRPSRLPSPWALVVMACMACACASAAADDDRDHERARAAVQAGEVLPLATLLERLQRTHPGQVLEVELEREDGRWIYELKLLQPGGQLLKLEVDAASGRVLQSRIKKARPAPTAPVTPR